MKYKRDPSGFALSFCAFLFFSDYYPFYGYGYLHAETRLSKKTTCEFPAWMNKVFIHPSVYLSVRPSAF